MPVVVKKEKQSQLLYYTPEFKKSNNFIAEFYTIQQFRTSMGIFKYIIKYYKSRHTLHLQCIIYTR